MATPIIVNPNKPSNVVVSVVGNKGGVIVTPSENNSIKVDNPRHSGTPISIDNSIDWGKIEAVAMDAAKEAVVDVIIPIDDELSTTSENAVQNKVITGEIELLKEENKELSDKVDILSKIAAAGIVL